MIAIALASTQCRHAVPAPLTTAQPLGCLGSTRATVEWSRLFPDRGSDQWCAQAGPPLVEHRPAASGGQIERLLIVSWNVHEGGGRVLDLVERLRHRATARRGSAMVLLLQETHRTGLDVGPPQAGGGIPKGIRPVRPTLDVAALGRYLDMSVAYVPSMRNGNTEGVDEGVATWEDRGNAILSTEPLSDVAAIELPFGAQRRVAVMAIMHPQGSEPLRMVSAHLDTFWHRGSQIRQAEALARYLEGRRNEAPIILGIDTNAPGGVNSRTIDALRRSVPVVAACGTRSTTRFAWRIDFLFSTIDTAAVESCETLRDSYGSDHRPLVLTIRTTRNDSRGR